MLASVIIVNFNGQPFLERCLNAVLQQELGEPFEVLLVDNGSSDDSIAYVRRGFPAVRVIDAARNLGFAGGNNLGIRAARGRYLVLLNNDTRVRPGWLRALIEAAEENPDAGAIASKLVFLDPPNTIQNAGSLLLSDGSGADRGFREPDRGQYDVTEEVFGACGASVLYRREMLEDVGAFDETFFMYYEDTDLNWRMRLRGWRVIYEPRAVVDHVHAGSSREWSPFFIFHVDRNRLLMLLKDASMSMVFRCYLTFGRMAADNAKGALTQRLGEWRLDRPRRSGTNAGNDDELRTVRHEISRSRMHLSVLRSLVIHLPEMLAKRAHIRRRRTVPDAEIERWFYPRERWDAR
jgi:GT2 family glycosyltransferase